MADRRNLIGSSWRGRRDGSSETRHVADIYLGGDLCFMTGRYRRNGANERCTEAEWDQWVIATKAKRVMG